MHLISRDDLTDEETLRIRRATRGEWFKTANGLVYSSEVVDVYAQMLDAFVEAFVLPNTPTVLSLGKLCREQKCSFHWSPTGEPTIISPKGRRILCRLHHNVPFAAPAAPDGEQEVYDLDDFRCDYETIPPREYPSEPYEVYDLDDMPEKPTEETEPKIPGTLGVPLLQNQEPDLRLTEEQAAK